MTKTSAPPPEPEAGPAESAAERSQRRFAALEQRVAEAADALIRQGRRATVATVRRALGGGSPNEVAPALKIWRTRQREAELAQLPPGFTEMPPLLAEQLLEFWRAARAAVREELRTNPSAMDPATRSEIEALRHELRELRDRWHREIEQGSQLHAELQRQKAVASQSRDHALAIEAQYRLAVQALDSARERLVELELTGAADKARLEKAEGELEALRSRNQQLAGALAHAATARHGAGASTGTGGRMLAKSSRKGARRAPRVKPKARQKFRKRPVGSTAPKRASRRKTRTKR